MSRTPMVDVRCDRCGAGGTCEQADFEMWYAAEDGTGEGGWERRGEIDLCSRCKKRRPAIHMVLDAPNGTTLHEMLTAFNHVLDDLRQAGSLNSRQGLYLGGDHLPGVQIRVLINQDKWVEQ